MSSLNLNLLLGGYNLSTIYGRERTSSCVASHESKETESLNGANGVQTASQAGREDSKNQISAPSQVESSPKSVEERFEEELEKRLSPDSDRRPVAASLTAQKLKAAALEISESLGQPKANQFMNKVLSAADSEPIAKDDSVGLAVESFFSEVANASTENPTVYQTLQDIKKNLNQSATSQTNDFEKKTGSNSLSDSTTKGLSESQKNLYQSYVQAKTPTLNAGLTFNRPSGFLVNAFI
jgi:hypothetical protein